MLRDKTKTAGSPGPRASFPPNLFQIASVVKENEHTDGHNRPLSFFICMCPNIPKKHNMVDMLFIICICPAEKLQGHSHFCQVLGKVFVPKYPQELFINIFCCDFILLSIFGNLVQFSFYD